MTHPEWFPSVPIFQPVDPRFCLATYFSDEIEENGGFTTKKYVADFLENNDLEFLQWYKDYQILYDWSEQRVMVSGYEQAWETAESINLHLIDSGSARWETEDVVVPLAKLFVDALEASKPSKGQLELQLIY